MLVTSSLVPNRPSGPALINKYLSGFTGRSGAMSFGVAPSAPKSWRSMMYRANVFLWIGSISCEGVRSAPDVPMA